MSLKEICAGEVRSAGEAELEAEDSDEDETPLSERLPSARAAAALPQPDAQTVRL